MTVVATNSYVWWRVFVRCCRPTHLSSMHFRWVILEKCICWVTNLIHFFHGFLQWLLKTNSSFKVVIYWGYLSELWFYILLKVCNWQWTHGGSARSPILQHKSQQTPAWRLFKRQTYEGLIRRTLPCVSFSHAIIFHLNTSWHLARKKKAEIF